MRFSSRSIWKYIYKCRAILASSKYRCENEIENENERDRIYKSVPKKENCDGKIIYLISTFRIWKELHVRKLVMQKKKPTKKKKKPNASAQQQNDQRICRIQFQGIKIKLRFSIQMEEIFLIRKSKFQNHTLLNTQTLNEHEHKLQF